MILPPPPSRTIPQLFACLVMHKLNHYLYLICRGLWDLVANQMSAIKLDTTRNTPIHPLRASTFSLTFLFAFYKFISSQLLCGKLDLAKERSLFISNPNWALEFSQVLLVRNGSHLFCIRDCCTCVRFCMRHKNWAFASTHSQLQQPQLKKKASSNQVYVTENYIMQCT